MTEVHWSDYPDSRGRFGPFGGRFVPESPEQEARLRELLALIVSHPSFQRQ